MRSFLIGLAISVLWIAEPAFGVQCRDIFASVNARDVRDFPLARIFAGQESVGYVYAAYKAARDAGLTFPLSLENMSAAQRRTLIASLRRELRTPVPVIIDPSGRYFAVDGHHDIFVLAKVLGNLEGVTVPIEVVRDFSATSIRRGDFLREVRENGWLYGKTIGRVLDRPIPITELVDSVERSVTGLAFIRVAKSEEVPMKGKHFSPFIQFLLADYLRQRNLIVFSPEFRPEDVDTVVELIQHDRGVRRFLRGHLRESAPRSLRRFFAP